MEFRQLKTFCAVVEEGSFTRAAASRVHLTQPTVSLQIKALEDELGIRLFERRDRKITLTRSGEILYDYAQKVLKTLEEAREEINVSSGVVEGELRIGTGVTVGESIMPKFLGSFKEIYPEIKITLHILDTEEIIRKITERRLDFGIVGAEVRRGDLVLEEFMQEPLILIVPPSHRWADGEGITLAQLKDEPLLVREKGSGTRMTIKRALQDRGILENDLSIVTDLGSTGAIKQGVMDGVGVAIVNRAAVNNELKTGLLKEVPLKDLFINKKFYLVYRPKKTFSRLFNLLLQFLRIELRSCTKESP